MFKVTGGTCESAGGKTCSDNNTNRYDQLRNMLVGKKEYWNVSHTNLSKYFIERLLQLTDYNELISNRHKTTNGYILLAEINEVTRLVLNRQKSIYRLKSLITESLDTRLSSSIVNDPVLKKYHKDIIEYYKSIDTLGIENNEKSIKLLQTQTRVYLKKLDLDYYDNLKQEFSSIDFENEKHFRRYQNELDKYIEVLVPFLIFKGYSVESIAKVAMLMTRKDFKVSIRLFFSIFNLTEREIEFVLNTSNDVLTNEYLIKYLEDQKLEYRTVKSSTLKLELDQDVDLTEDIIIFKTKTLDANTYIRDTYDTFIKNFIISKERTSLEYFLDFFDKTHWKLINGKDEKYKKSGFKHDPINVISRESTLRTTLSKVSSFYGFTFTEYSSLHKINCIAESIYFYNLALGSKSIENSLNLLWTSLETLIPYGKFESDIANIQYFFPKYLSTGSVGRQLMSFSLRFLDANSTNNYCLNSVKSNVDYIKTFDVDNIVKWLDFVLRPSTKDDDPFYPLKECSELLSSQYCKLNEGWGKSNEATPKFGKLKLWKDRIDSSRLSIQYQLDRIYLHRNQIVHTAKFINEYSNLWAHLEWYVGKILSYFYIKSFQSNAELRKKDVLIELEGECEMIYEFITREKDKNILDLSPLDKKKLLMQIWQFM